MTKISRKVNKIILYIVIFLDIIPAFAGNNASCPEIKTEINIINQIREEFLQYDNSKSIKEITEITEEKEGKKSKDLVLGLFRPDILYETGGYIDLADDGCIDLLHVDITASFTSTIYIAKEYKKGSEQYDYLLNHEKKHAEIAIENNKKYFPALKEKLVAYVKTIKMDKPQTDNEGYAVRNNILAEINRMLINNLNQIKDKVEDLQKRFDEEELERDKELYLETKKNFLDIINLPVN